MREEFFVRPILRSEMAEFLLAKRRWNSNSEIGSENNRGPARKTGCRRSRRIAISARKFDFCHPGEPLRYMNTNRDGAVGKRILVVDDERLLREVMRLSLGKAGFTVVESNNGAEALALFAKGRFDMVIVDYEMPFLKGNELAAAIRRIAPQQKIVMVTGFRRKAGPDNPVDAVLGKPVDYARLGLMVDNFLNGAGEAPGGTEFVARRQSN